ncbi:MAG: hypothetical protein KF767_17855 [Bdellovibrionaceae bacterium]|nr:hypothetical protein [Pseudobdellovibrionaceae bacterium]
MKLASTVLLAALALSLPSFANQTAPGQPPAQNTKEVSIGVSEAYVPAGFDSTTEAYVIVSGMFNNGCYQWSRAEVRHVDDFNHEVSTFAKVSPGMCLMVLVPYQKEVKLGTLKSGKHIVRFVGGDATYLEKTFEVE